MSHKIRINSALNSDRGRNVGDALEVLSAIQRSKTGFAFQNANWAPHTSRLPRWSKLVAIVLAAMLMPICWQVGLARDTGAPVVPPQAYQALKWRNVGPFRGGRTTAVAGIASQPHTFYIGASGGGVWKSINAGESWKNVSDGFFKVGGIGAIAVAPSNPNSIYVGTGEASVRNHSTSRGDGVYGSKDDGRTWVHMGLEKTEHIAGIAVNPQNDKVVYVAAQGSPWVPSPDRGVYRSRDGGKTWQRVLFVNNTSGAHSVSIDPKNPDVLYVSMWDSRRLPWTLRSGGPGSGIWKSVDGGDHWQKMTDGLPKLMGISSVSVSAADPNWVYAMIEAEHGGVFRSTDSGQHWERVNNNHGLRTRAWYYTIIAADPVDRGTVYVLGDGGVIGKSTDGGKELKPMRVPHGDNHALWINPDNNKIMVEGNDGGGTVTLDGGISWSDENNQPTGQFYRVFVDNSIPYRLYGSQQDAGTASVPSRSSNAAGIGAADEYTVGGGESGHISMNLEHPDSIYAASMLGEVTRYDQRTKQVRDITPYPYWTGFRVAKDVKYRFNWTMPVLASQFDPNTVYVGSQYVLESNDKGETWHEMSPDLTENNKDHQGPDMGPLSIGGGGYSNYDTIVSLAESPSDRNTLWAGSDDGMVHVTRDGGKHWADVTPPDVKKSHAYVRSIDISRRSEGTVYVAANRYRFGDFRPMIFVTHNFGKSWASIVHGIPDNEYVGVVREDPIKAGLIYAGTDRGMYVSFDDGGSWQSFQQNMPVVPITDLQVHGDDLVAATQGRSFWILDGLDALRQLNANSIAAKMYLFKPDTAYRTGVSRSLLHSGPYGENPPSGAVIRYSFLSDPNISNTPVVLQILGPDKKLITQITSEGKSAAHTADAFLKGAGAAGKHDTLPVAAGMNSYVWNLRTAPYVPTADEWEYVSARPHRVAPGTYYARLTYGGQSVTESFEVAADPRYVQHPAAEWSKQQALLGQLTDLMNDINRSNNQMRSVVQQVGERMHAAAKGGQSAAVCHAANVVVQQIAKWGQQAVQPPLPNNVQDYNNWPTRSFGVLVLALMPAVDQDPPLTSAQIEVTKQLQAKWSGIKNGMKTIEGGSLAKLNQMLAKAGVSLIEVPSGMEMAPVVPAVPADVCSGAQ